MKKWLVTAGVLVALGIIIFISAMASLGWDFTRINTARYVSNAYVIDEAFEKIRIDTDTAYISFVSSDDGVCRVECYENENVKHSVGVSEETLNINVTDERKWYEYISISFESPKITVYLPENEYASLVINDDTGSIEIPKDFKFESLDITANTGSIKNYASVTKDAKIKTSTGSIYTEGASFGTLELSVSTGHISAKDIICDGDVKVNASTGKTELKNVTCASLLSQGSTGNITLKDVISKGKLHIERSTGDIELDRCDGVELFIKTDTGDVEGTLLSDKIFTVRTETGNVDVPKTTSGGKCEIETETGDIDIDILK